MGGVALNLKSVLQLNVRLSEGGAAGVARTLADELVARGVESPIAYGYSRGGSASPIEAEYNGVRVTPRLNAAVNRLSHSVLGRDTKLVSPKHWSNFRKSLAETDVVHLHAIHSHIVDADLLFRALIDAGKPVVWTLHDQWAMTGRCAQPGTCRLWENGCPKCPNLAAYPPAKIDMAAKRWPERREMIQALQASVPTAVIACADWLGDEAKLASIRNVGVIKNSVDRAFWQASSKEAPKALTGGVRNLFMCRDLRDKQKVNWSVLQRVAALTDQSLTIVGDQAPQIVDGARMHPAVSDRAQLANLMQEHDRLVFTSRVDYFPLTIAEALTSGLEVDALDSPAAREFSMHPKLNIFENEDALLTHLTNEPLESQSLTYGLNRERDFFDPRRMTDEYVDVYNSLLGE
jgi:putative colanic acid biosynthesis glycosyltransferase